MSNNGIIPYVTSTAVSLVDIRMDSEKFPRIKNLSRDVAVEELAKVIAMANAYTGREVTREATLLLATSLYFEIMTDDRGIGLPNITIEEIGRVVKRAVLGEAEMYGINVSSLYKVICEYCTGEGHAAQEAANNRHAAERLQLLKGTAVGTMLDAFAGKLITKNKKNR